MLEKRKSICAEARVMFEISGIARLVAAWWCAKAIDW
jgi:hypothetical protein